MRISYNTLNRIAEQKAAELRAQGKPMPKPGRYVLSEARELSEDQLLQRLRDLGMELDHQRLDSLVKSHCSAEEIAKEFLDRWRPRSGQEKVEDDWCWFALTVLSERWFGEVPNFERLDDAMQKGYEQKEESAQCDIWLGVWADLLKLREKARCRSLAEFDGIERTFWSGSPVSMKTKAGEGKRRNSSAVAPPSETRSLDPGRA